MIVAKASWIKMVWISVSHELGMCKLRVNILVTFIFIYSIVTVIMSLRSQKCGSILQLACDVET